MRFLKDTVPLHAVLTQYYSRVFSVLIHGSTNYLHPMELAGPDPQVLKDLVTMKMPFGKYKGRVLCDLPVHYLEWFASEGFPKGKLGMLLSTIYEIKINGLTGLLEPLRKGYVE